MKLLQLLMLPLIAIDCMGNWVVGGSFNNTLSGEAWNQRNQPYWGWTHKAIDRLFFWQPHHCKTQSEREAAQGGVWKAWRLKFAGTPTPVKG